MTFKQSILTAALVSFASMAIGNDKYPSVSEYESTVLTFDEGAGGMSADEVTKLSKAVADAKAKGKISRIEVAAWSDKEHPVTGDLSKADIKLAHDRFEAIELNLRKDIGHMRYIKSYNMADNSNWVGRHLHSSDAELDAVFAKKEAGHLARQDFALIKEGGKASKAVVILKIRDK